MDFVNATILNIKINNQIIYVDLIQRSGLTSSSFFYNILLLTGGIKYKPIIGDSVLLYRPLQSMSSSFMFAICGSATSIILDNISLERMEDQKRVDENLLVLQSLTTFLTSLATIPTMAPILPVINATRTVIINATNATNISKATSLNLKTLFDLQKF